MQQGKTPIENHRELRDELSGKGHAGKHGLKFLPSYLSNINGLELSSRIKALALTATRAGLGFQFWEVFLNSGLHNSGNTLAQHSSRSYSSR